MTAEPIHVPYLGADTDAIDLDADHAPEWANPGRLLNLVAGTEVKPGIRWTQRCDRCRVTWYGTDSDCWCCEGGGCGCG